VLTFLEQHGVSRLEAVFISHADADHLGGLLSLLAKVDTDSTFSIGHIYLNPDARDSKVWGDLTFQLDQMERRKILNYSPQLGPDSPTAPLNLGGCSIEVLAPSKYMRLRAIDGRHLSGRRQSANSLSAVIRVTCGDAGWVLLPGDLDHLGLADAIDRNTWRDAPVMVFPHHGGRAGTDAQTRQLTSGIVDASQSQYVLFSGRSNTDKFPSALVVDTLLGLQTNLVLYSIGDSPVLSQRIKAQVSCGHRNATGTLHVTPPNEGNVISIDSYKHRVAPTVVH
jgi:competence protein ComEC